MLPRHTTSAVIKSVTASRRDSCANVHFYAIICIFMATGKGRGSLQSVAISSNVLVRIISNDSIVELFPLRIFINHLILVCVVLISPQHQAGRVKLPAAVHGSHHLMPQGLGKDTKSLMRILSKIEEPNRGSTTWRRLERGAAQGSMCSHRAKGLLIRQ